MLLCQRKKAFIAPQLLKASAPEYQFNFSQALIVKYKYRFMPKGIMTRFIVRMNKYIKGQELVWKEGVVLKRQDATAEVIESYENYEINIRVTGYGKKEMLTIILEAIDEINSSYEQLRVSKLIPCNCSNCILTPNPYYFTEKELKDYLKHKKYHIECRVPPYDKISVQSLIDEIFPKYHLNENIKLIGKIALEDKVDILKRYVKENNIETIFGELLSEVKDKSINQYYNEIYMLMCRYSNLGSEVRVGLLSREQERLERNKITKKCFGLY